jgi:large subunit ribosomal protein L6
MSRIGRKPVPIPKNVTVTIDGTTVKVKGPKGELTREFRSEMRIQEEDGRLVIGRA